MQQIKSEENVLKKIFPQFETALIEEMQEHGSIREVKAGDTLLKIGQSIRSTMLVTSGLIKLYREDAEGKEFFIYHLDAGQACSLSMVCAARQETSEVLAKAVTDATILSIPLQFMEAWMPKYKSWYQFVITSYRDRFEEVLKTVDAIAFTKMDERLVFYLKRHQEHTYTNHVHTSFTQIAQELNTSREVVSRLMKKLSEKEMIRMHRNYIEIINLD